jgi:hypothetical protein
MTTNTERNKSYYQKNREKLLEDAKEYYRQNKEKVLAYKAVYNEENKEHRQKRDREYYRNKHEVRMVGGARARAKKFNLEFSLTKEDIFVPETCPLLGIPLFIADGKKNAKPNSPSLDRIDPSKGYTPDNVWVISHKANTMKSNATFEEFEEMYKKWVELRATGCKFGLLYNQKNGILSETTLLTEEPL